MKKNETTPPQPTEDTEALSDESYRRLLIELSNTVFWKIILAQSRKIDATCIQTLASVDPFKEPTLVARTQGMRSGLYALENEVNMILDEIRDEVK